MGLHLKSTGSKKRNARKRKAGFNKKKQDLWGEQNQGASNSIKHRCGFRTFDE